MASTNIARIKVRYSTYWLYYIPLFYSKHIFNTKFYYHSIWQCTYKSMRMIYIGMPILLNLFDCIVFMYLKSFFFCWSRYIKPTVNTTMYIIMCLYENIFLYDCLCVWCTIWRRHATQLIEMKATLSRFSSNKINNTRA